MLERRGRVVRLRCASTMVLLVIVVIVQLTEGFTVSQCGIQSFHDKIVNGNDTAIDEYPWMALFRYHNRKRESESWGCSGAYIGGKTVVTAAHCVDNSALNSLGDLKFVRFGEYDTSKDIDCVESLDTGSEDCADPPIDILVSSIILNPNWKHIPEAKDNDLALIILVNEPPYTDFIRPICLPKSNEVLDDGLKLFVAGWGWIYGLGPSPSNIKLHTRVYPVAHAMCNDLFKSMINDNSQICAGGRNGSSPCRGDSGGPLMSTKSGDEWTLTGIVSYGPNECNMQGYKERPTIFTNIIHFLPWIDANAV